MGSTSLMKTRAEGRCRSELVMDAAACENLRESPIPVVMIASNCLESLGQVRRIAGKGYRKTLLPSLRLYILVSLQL